MDQDSVSGGKSSWRDRLGIPKDEAEGNIAEVAGRPVPEATRTAPRAPFSSAEAGRPASAAPSSPMAPRAPLPSARPAPLSPRMEPDASQSSTAPRPNASEGLAERLRVQREAAERMAEQRLALARQRAAARVQEAQATAAPRIVAPGAAPAAPAVPIAKAPPANPAAAAPAAAPPAAVQPRFSFADEINRAKRAPAAPVRPATLPPLRASNAPHGAPATSSGHRSDPRFDGLRAPTAPAAPRPPLRPRIADGQTSQPFGSDFNDDFEDNFLEPAATHAGQRPQAVRPPLALASVRRNDQAGSSEDQYFSAERVADIDKKPAQRKGPLLLLGSLLGIIMLFAVGIYVWQQTPSDTASEPAAADVPVVTAPVAPIKMEPSAETNGDEVAAGEVAGKKQIYDRILGDEEQGGVPENIVPSEESPVPQGAATDSFATTPIETPASVPPAAEPPADDLLPIPAEPEAPGPNGALDLEPPAAMASALPVPAETQLAEPETAAPAEVAALDPPAIETPAIETPAVETPAVETAAVETPADTPAVKIPGVDSSAPAAPGPISLVVTPRQLSRPTFCPRSHQSPLRRPLAGSPDSC